MSEGDLNKLLLEYFDCHQTMADAIKPSDFAVAAARANELRGAIISARSMSARERIDLMAGERRLSKLQDSAAPQEGNRG